MKNILSIIFVLFLSASFGQEKAPKVQQISFKTSAQCGMCKERIEEELNYTKGIIFAELDVDSQILTVKYKTKFLNQEKVKYLVTKIGYNAGEFPRDNKAYEKLPKCCQDGGHK
ncbi:cation transporter [Paracrocinitomix mangrovi]|uniref:heavy-metal-associated domain-containing protein n=1 Tax=Paracrocinitomix mangrovi TaxID=2862509 RepID=UPI001C8F1B16|nr:cation transporter [Paracrocinitomix mangrovi]UKN02552.1 cation transporter [Paracrocinitomix mangrovi]